MKKLFIILISLSSFLSTFAFPLVSTEMVTRQKTSFNKTIFAFKNGKTIELNYTFGCVGAEVKHEIQRSANGVLFNTIFEETLLLAECGKTFNFTDNNPIAGINYYRIKLTDPDGRIRFSELTSINFIIGNSTKLIPTIATSFVNVYFYATENGNSNWSIISIDGKVLHTKFEFLNKGQNTISFDVANFKGGLYFIKNNDIKKTIEILSFIKR